jgi:hypothetical protein
MHCSPRPARRVARSLCRPRGTGDIDRVVGWVGGLPRLDFEGHKGCVSSFTGEKLTESDVHAAIRSAVGHSSINHGFCVVPVWGQPPGYVLIMEWQDRAAAGSDRFVGHVESELHRVNSEYAEKQLSHRLAPLRARVVPPGTFNWLAERRAARGASAAQVKHRWLQADGPLLEELADLDLPTTVDATEGQR